MKQIRFTRYFVTSSILVALLCASRAAATTYTVLPDGTGDFPTIQAAIDAVIDGDIIELGDGPFRGEGNREIDYLGKAITVRSQSGDPEACIIDCQEAARAFHFHSGEDSGATLAGISITNGTAPGLTYPESIGGGILCAASSSPTIVNCILSSNQADAAGGGIACIETSSPDIADCIITQNEAFMTGGGVFCNDSAPTLTRCAISGNQNYHSIAGHGGGVGCIEASPALIDCTLSNNVAGSGYLAAGGGFYCASYSSPTLVGCIIAGNAVGDGTGGGFFCHFYSTPMLSDCTFYGNSGVGGGAVHSHFFSTIVLENSIISFSSEGVAVLCDEYGSAMLTCCDVYGNAGGDWVGCIEEQYGVNGNFSDDPLFCLDDNPAVPYSLHEGSPCLPENSPCGELVGAFGEGCGPISPVEDMSWGAIKAMFK